MLCVTQGLGVVSQSHGWCSKADWSNAKLPKTCTLTKLTWHFLCLLGLGYQSICNHLNSRPLKYSLPKPQHFTAPTGSTKIYLLHIYVAQPVALIHPTGSQLLGVWPSAVLSKGNWESSSPQCLEFKVTVEGTAEPKRAQGSAEAEGFYGRLSQ